MLHLFLSGFKEYTSFFRDLKVKTLFIALFMKFGDLKVNETD